MKRVAICLSLVLAAILAGCASAPEKDPEESRPRKEKKQGPPPEEEPRDPIGCGLPE